MSNDKLIDDYLQRCYDDTIEFYKEIFQTNMESYKNLSDMGLQISNRSDFRKGWVSGVFVKYVESNITKLSNLLDTKKIYFDKQKLGYLQKLFSYIGDSNEP